MRAIDLTGRYNIDFELKRYVLRGTIATPVEIELFHVETYGLEGYSLRQYGEYLDRTYETINDDDERVGYIRRVYVRALPMYGDMHYSICR